MVGFYNPEATYATNAPSHAKLACPVHTKDCALNAGTDFMLMVKHAQDAMTVARHAML